MKILFIHPSSELYGSDKILLYMIEFLNSKNDITLLVGKNGILLEKIRAISKEIKICVDDKLPVVHSKLRVKDFIALPFRLFQFSKRFSKNEFDIVYCNTLATVLLLYVSWSKKRIIHIHEIISNKILNFAFSVLVWLRAKYVICVSQHVKTHLLFSKEYRVIHNGIPDEVKSFSHNNVGEKIIFTLPGRIMPQKGQWFVLDALSILPKEYRDKIEIRMYGSPPPYKKFLLEELKQKLEMSNLSDVVILFDFAMNISEIYSDANVVLVPSIMADPFPTTVLEALEFSRPVISTNHGGASEILDASCSILVSPGNIAELSSAIKFFIDNVSLIDEFSKNARRKFDEKLSVEIFKNNFFQYLSTLI